MPKRKRVATSKTARKDQSDSADAAVAVKREKVDEPSTSQDTSEEKVVQFTGSVPVDEGFPQYANGPYHVYEEQFNVYNAMLNQTNIGENNNKYYIIQIIKHNVNLEFITLSRWGRVGKVAGSSQEKVPLGRAKQLFESKFRSKTGNSWQFRSRFIKRKGKYDLLEIDYGENEARKEVDAKGIKKEDAEVPSALDERVQNVMKLIFDTTEWEATVKEMKFDIKKSPLGKLTKNQIKGGYESLKKVEDCLKPGTPETDLVEACSEFYTRVPHDFGMKRPPLIRTPEELKEKLQLIEALNDIQIAVSVINTQDDKKDVNQLDCYYNSLNCDLVPLDKSNPDFKTVEKYVKNTHDHLHTYFKLNIEDIFKVSREHDNTRFKQEIGNRMLLWHGSRLTNWCGILKEGLRIAPPEAPVTGYMFGKGVYFADIVSKSAGYCYTSVRQPMGFLLICEVALGNMNEKKNADSNASNLPKGKHSTKGMGTTAPPSSKNLKLPDGTIVPLGKPADTKLDGTYLRYNEYIVYDTAQIKPRYLVKLKFTFTNCF